MKAGAQVNPARAVFVSRDIIGKVIDAAPDGEWRLLIAMSRFGGLRVPSEALALRWSGTDQEHEGHGRGALPPNHGRRLGEAMAEAGPNGQQQIRPSIPQHKGAHGPKYPNSVTSKTLKTSVWAGIGVWCKAVPTGPMGSPGLEPGTPAFSMRCSTN